jgi:hypothetical protein
MTSDDVENLTSLIEKKANRDEIMELLETKANK